MVTHKFKRFKSPRNPWSSVWLGIFKPNCQNHVIWLFPTTNIESSTTVGPKRRNSNSRWRTAAIFENVASAITGVQMNRCGWNLGVHSKWCLLCVRHVPVAVVTTVACQRSSEHTAVTGMRRLNAWTDFRSKFASIVTVVFPKGYSGVNWEF